jgi:Tetracyclin repressor-like, C-terminal domain
MRIPLPTGAASPRSTTYFPDMASILDAVLDDLIGNVERSSRKASWRRGLIGLMSSYRRLLLTQPGLIALTVSRPQIGPNAIRVREDGLALLKQAGLSDADAVRVYLCLRLHDRLRHVRNRKAAQVAQRGTAGLYAGAPRGPPRRRLPDDPRAREAPR